MREVPLVMPKMSMTMTEGTFLQWILEEGAEVKAGDVVCEVESDKVDMEVESPVAGVLTRHVAAPDAVVAVGAPLAFISTDADDMLEGLFDEDPETESPADAVPADGPAKPARDVASPVGSPPSRRGPRPAVPRARRRASELRVDIETVEGSGPEGVITVGDVEAVAASRAVKPAQAAVEVPPSEATRALPPVHEAPARDEEVNPFAAFGPMTAEPLSRINRVSGSALARAWNSIPHVTHHDRADITELDAYRRELDDDARRDGYRVTLLAFILKACVSALKEFPRVNSSLAEDGSSLLLKGYYHLGVAVDTEVGLVVPVIRDVDRKGIAEISRDLAAVSERARDGKLTADDVTGASFTVSSLGGIGGTGFTPIVNAPEAAILGVSRSSTEPVWDGEQFIPRLTLPLSLSYDHRIIDGALAARFTARLSHLLGDVRRLVL